MADKFGKAKQESRERRQRRVRGRINGTSARPRLSVFRSLSNIFAQVIDDEQGFTLASASTIDKDIAGQVQGKSKTEAAKIVGQMVADRAKKAGVEAVIFDRGGYQYHGRVAALAAGAREGELKF